MVSTAFAQELRLNYAFEPVPTNVNGQSGVFFPAKDTEYLLYLRTDVIPTLVARSEAQALVLDLDTKQIADLEVKVKLEQDKFNVAIKAEESCQFALTKCTNRPNAWYMHPALWTGVGIVVGVATTVLIVRAGK